MVMEDMENDTAVKVQYREHYGDAEYENSTWMR
jgi:hypothetical protein